MFLKIPKYYLEYPNLRANFLFLISCYSWVGFFMHRAKSHVSVFLKGGENMQLHVSVMFTSYVYVNVVYAATETRENVTKPVTETQVIRRVSGTV